MFAEDPLRRRKKTVLLDWHPMLPERLWQDLKLLKADVLPAFSEAS
jgi:hypothetical protein